MPFSWIAEGVPGNILWRKAEFQRQKREVEMFSANSIPPSTPLFQGVTRVFDRHLLQPGLVLQPSLRLLVAQMPPLYHKFLIKRALP